MWKRPRACILTSLRTMRKPRGDPRPRLRSRPRVPSQHHVGVPARALPPVLQCCGGVQRQPGVADAIIEAQSVPLRVIGGGITSAGEQAPQSDHIIWAPWQHAHVLHQSIRVVVWTHRRWTDCACCDRGARQRPYAGPAAPTPKKRAGAHAVQGTIASPPHHEEWSSWRLSDDQACLAGASRLPGCPASVARLRPLGSGVGTGVCGPGPLGSSPWTSRSSSRPHA
jgi:hypothetical protein